jgi:predicted nucleotidyltransferase
MKITDVENQLIFKCISGSHVYGTNTAESDIDYRGVFAIPSASYFRLNKPPEQVSDEKQDTVYYTTYRFLELACAGNPNILELLWMPEDCVELSSRAWQSITDIRQTFITKSVLDAFGGYAVAQIKKAKGQNKLVNNPMSEKKPTKEDFCWVVSLYPLDQLKGSDCLYYGSDAKFGIDQPFRPVKVTELDDFKTWGYDFFKRYNVSAVAHVIDTYRLYYYGDDAKGVFRGDDTADIVPANIPIEDEYTKFAGILIYHKDAYERELKLWKQYWGWRQNRNEARWRDQEDDTKEMRFDRKNMMHCMRLLYSGENILENGEPIVRFSGEKLQRLKDIRAGIISYESILAEAEERLAKLDEGRKVCTLPTKPDFDLVNELSINLHKE